MAPLCALLLAALPATVMAQVLAQAIPSQYDLQLEPGKGESRPLYLHNMGRESVRVRLRLADFRMSARGALDLLPAGTLASTLARPPGSSSPRSSSWRRESARWCAWR
jgi:hypothetical protein